MPEADPGDEEQPRSIGGSLAEGGDVAGWRQGHAIATLVLGAIQRLIRPTQRFICGRLVPCKVGNAETGSHAQCGALRVQRNFGFGDGAPQSLCHAFRLWQGRVRQNDDEFLPALADDQIRRADTARELVGHVTQHRVADGMAIRVVYSLEPIQIAHDQRQSPALTDSAGVQTT
jgi:hypothetical protein